MRYALVSDIHANLQAWNAVLTDIRSDSVDEIICLGDMVGYGPNPAEVLQSMHSQVAHFVIGNHDAVVGGNLDDALFNDDAQEIIRWTRHQLNNEAVGFLRSLPLSLEGGFFRCAHADFSDPAAFNYIVEPSDALPSWQTVEEQLLFIGHTHDPGLFLLGESGTPRLVSPQDFALEDGKRYIVRVGSVGQPRDGDARASYCLLDTDTNSIFWRKVPFDLDAYSNALDSAGIPRGPSYFLRHDPRQGVPPLRELLSFSPPTSADKKAKRLVEVQELHVLEKKVSRWKALSVMAIVMALSLITAAATLFWMHKTRSLDIPDPISTTLEAAAFPEGYNLLSSPGSATRAGEPIPGWNIRLGNKRAQSISVEKGNPTESVIRFRSSSDRDDLRLASSLIEVKPGMKLCLQGAFQKDPGFAGQVALVVSLVKGSGNKAEEIDQFLVKEPTQAKKNGWSTAKQTFTLPAGATAIRFGIQGRFTGTVRAASVSLSRVE